MKERLLAILTLGIFAMLNASANEVAKSCCEITIKECISFTEACRQSDNISSKNIKAEDGIKERTCLPVDVMTLLAYQVKGNEGVERYLTKHGFKYEGRFVPEDLNPEFYFQKKYCKGCTVNKKGEVVIKKEKEVNKKGEAKNNKGQIKKEDQQGCMVEIGSLGFGPCTTITIFDKTEWQAIISLLKSKGFKEYKNEDSDCSLVMNKTCVDFWHNSNNTWGLTIWTDNLR
mgnify:CR=1 FL=1